MAKRYTAGLEERGAPHSSTILLVDDEPVVLRILEQICTREGYQVRKASEAREALVACREESIDLAIIDIYMPGMNGLELIRRLHLNFPHIAIIAMSGGGPMAGKNVLELARARGAAHAFGKPFNLEELKAAIRSSLDLA